MQNMFIETLSAHPVSHRQVEIVERKGLGHPDTICDSLMEATSVALCAEYLKRAGRVLHHNLDKGLLVAGQTTPALRGGRVDTPMRIIFGDRATCEWQGIKLPLDEILQATASRWFRENLRFVDPAKHLILQNEIKPGSPELVDIFSRGKMTANDTSAAVGYAPLSETEQIVLAAERFLNSRAFKERHPETGEDVKVMAVRHGRLLHLTVAVAFVDRFIPDASVYFSLKAEVQQELTEHLTPLLHELDGLKLQLNTLDDPSRGTSGIYLTVLGTSAEGADGGQIGRGNRVNGLISLHRPMGTEAAAGKNPVSHVGKIYSVLSHQLADRIYTVVEGVQQVDIWLCSQIGRALDDPWSISANLILSPGMHLSDVEQRVRTVVQDEIRMVFQLTERLCRGEIPVC